MWSLITIYSVQWGFKGLFSSINCISRESVRTTSQKGMLQEMGDKAEQLRHTGYYGKMTESTAGTRANNYRMELRNTALSSIIINSLVGKTCIER